MEQIGERERDCCMLHFNACNADIMRRCSSDNVAANSHKASMNFNEIEGARERERKEANFAT